MAYSRSKSQNNAEQLPQSTIKNFEFCRKNGEKFRYFCLILFALFRNWKTPSPKKWFAERAAPIENGGERWKSMKQQNIFAIIASMSLQMFGQMGSLFANTDHVMHNFRAR